MHKDKYESFNFNDITTKKTNYRKVENDISFKIYKLQVKDSSVLFKDDILNFMFLDFFDKL